VAVGLAAGLVEVGAGAVAAGVVGVGAVRVVVDGAVAVEVPAGAGPAGEVVAGEGGGGVPSRPVTVNVRRGLRLVHLPPSLKANQYV
jgi:hypothetical protein